MYTKYDIGAGNWVILDPEGDALAMCSSEGQADTLLSHLNRD